MARESSASLSTLPTTAALALASVIAIAIFMTGFLLTRIELPKYSQCSDPPASYAFMTEFAGKHDFSAQYQLVLEKWVKSGRPPLEGSESGAAGCWTPRRFRKAVLVIIDAMRFDFVHTDPTVPESGANVNFRNHLRLFEQLQHSQPEHCKLFVFEADPPTTTMQRLKGLVTGGMPTFIDISSNFDSSAITEDNILFQLARSSLELVMMGDDTWIKLFPNLFSRAFPYPSFNVKDLHTVDNGVIAHLRPEIDAGKFDLLIAHFLGVDHVGHRFYANHPTMKDKLLQLNDVLEDLVSAIDENTILFVLGDHGMTAEGNHGGTTKQETDTGLFTYSRQKIFPASNNTHTHSQIKQVDLVPTLSLLLGSAIPYGSLGTVMSELFTVGALDPWKRACGALRINAWQVQRYLHDYSASTHLFEPELLQHLTAEFLSVDHEYIQLAIDQQSQNFNAETAYMDLTKRYEAVLSRSQSMCREKWTMFDLTTMTYGVALLLLVAVALGLNAGLEPIVQRNLYVKYALSSSMICSPLICYWSGVPSHTSIILSIAAGVLVHIIVSSFSSPRRNLRIPHPTVLIAIGMMVPYCGALFSNSMVIIESNVINYYSTSFCFLLALFDLRHPSADAPQIALCCLLTSACLRLMGNGEHFGPGAMLAEEFFSLSQLLETFGSLMSLAMMSSRYARTIENSAIRIYFKAWASICFFVTSVYWYLDASVALDQPAPWHWLPQLVYGASLVLAVIAITCRVHLNRSHCLNMLMASFICPCLLLLGPKSPFVFLLTLVVIYLRCFRLWSLNSSVHNGIPECIFFWLLGIRLYFATGHSNSFNSLQVSSAFVGFEQFDYYRSGVMLILNTFGGFLVCGMGLAIVSPDYSVDQLPPLHKSDYRRRGYGFERPAMVIISLHVIRAGFSTLNVLFNRRHLMVWDIFAPKFVFDTVSLAAVALIMLTIVMINRLL